MSSPTRAEIERAADEIGSEPLYTQAWWRMAVKQLLFNIDLLEEERRTKSAPEAKRSPYYDG